ncbi:MULTISPECIES: DUF1615 domain-containing protein [unclassified Paludibacterium]|uniref:DUF1615 domain-containing protein n=1 Tax=unclassified Paludibacterium TaxID=2618429 RepID=UPI001C049246|nr:DUF1615 domain-containing protein [Paludibacterium sp. B53371]BEV71110.1 DUF1615 family protein [Paludibacterium sp. THUN1379]
MLLRRLRPLFLPLLLTACAATQPPAPVSPASSPLPETASAPVVSPPLPTPVVPAPPAAVPAKPVPAPNYNNPQAGRALLDRLLPRGIPARQAWSENIFAAFTQLKIPYAPQYFCAVLAVAEQESGFSPDPEVPNLSAIVWKQIDEHRKKYMIPQLVIDAAMLKTSPDGRSYKERVNALRTKRQMNQLYEDMVREMPYGQDLLLAKNPIRDGGPMQVSVAFAQTQIKAWPYPYSYANLRDEVFSLRGSVYFGTAILLQYAAPYDRMIYRFADYNAGRYSSRNAAFQAAVARLSGQKLALDGDLMLYSNKMNRVFSGQASATQKVLSGMADRLQMSVADVVRDLKQEKLSSFEQTTLYQRVFAAADRQAGRKVAREIIPQIVLISPKFTRQLSTEWFATRVNGRYERCMARGGFKAD